MGAVIQLTTHKYELMYKQFYKQGKLNLKLDEISKTEAEQYISKQHRKAYMKNILRVVK